MDTIFFVLLLIGLVGAIPPSPPPLDGCDYEHNIRTYFCKNINEFFPNQFYGNYHVRCIDCKIETFSPETFPYTNSLVSFNVSESGIHRLTTRALSKLTNVQYIYLHSNEISVIDPGAFAGLRQVYELHLADNELQFLTPQFLDDIEVNSVDLSRNKLVKLTKKPFDGSLGILVLDLSKNSIAELHADAFVGLDSIEIINLELNRLCHIPLGVFRHLDTLRQLNLADNKLSTFMTGTFSGLVNLNSLNLANNSVSNFDGNILLPFNHLSKLDISGNGIYYFDADAIHSNVPTLRVLRMDDNLFSCGLLMNIVRYFKKVSVEVVNTVGRHEVLNVNGIACTEIDMIERVDFELFLKHAAETTKKYVKYCPT